MSLSSTHEVLFSSKLALVWPTKQTPWSLANKSTQLKST